MQRLGQSVRNLSAVFGALKLGLVVAGIMALVQAVGALAGGVVALIPALASAAGAIAALPATLGAAIQGLLGFKVAVGGVGEALKAGMSLQQNAGRSAQQYADMQTSAANSVRNAERQLYLSQRASKDAQVQLTEARRAARRELVDMKLAAEGAALSERRANLSTREARRNLTQTLTAPGSSTLDIQSARLAVQEAQFAGRQARVARGRATADNRRTQQRGVGGNQGVVQARRGLADATYNQAEATRSLAEAQRQATQQLAQGTGEMDAYAQAMKDLSPNARRFVEQVVAMRPAMIDLRNSGTEELFPHLSRGLERAVRLMPTARRLLRQTAGTIGEGAEGFANRMTTPGRIRDIGTIGNQQTRILSRMLRGVGNMGEALVDFMVAAEPFTDWSTKTVYGWTRCGAGEREGRARVGRHRSLPGGDPRQPGALRSHPGERVGHHARHLRCGAPARGASVERHRAPDAGVGGLRGVGRGLGQDPRLVQQALRPARGDVGAREGSRRGVGAAHRPAGVHPQRADPPRRGARHRALHDQRLGHGPASPRSWRSWRPCWATCR